MLSSLSQRFSCGGRRLDLFIQATVTELTQFVQLIVPLRLRSNSCPGPNLLSRWRDKDGQVGVRNRRPSVRDSQPAIWARSQGDAANTPQGPPNLSQKPLL